MLSAQTKDEYVLAWQVTKEHGPFYCPACNAEVRLKKGRVKAHHFAHKPPTDCVYGVGESEVHMRAKKEIYEALINNPHVTELQLERFLEDVRPDIYFCFDKTPVAIEVQISKLREEVIQKRTKAYGEKGISLLWISPVSKTIVPNKRYAPRRWEKYLHALYFGKVYYWLSGEILLPVHFDAYQLYVEESTWWEGEGEDAEEVSVGGYFKRSKRWRTPRFHDKVNITDLGPLTREVWSKSTISLPAVRLWCQPSARSARFENGEK